MSGLRERVLNSPGYGGPNPVVKLPRVPEGGVGKRGGIGQAIEKVWNYLFGPKVQGWNPTQAADDQRMREADARNAEYFKKYGR